MEKIPAILWIFFLQNTEDVAALEIATDEETGEGEFELLTFTISFAT